MSKTYLLTLTPREPYFFGNEKSFTYPGQKNGGQYGNKYFIRSEKMPSQSTVFGAVRYLMIPNKSSEYHYDAAELEKVIGAESFDADKSDQTFGQIERISPIYLCHTKDGVQRLLIPTPFNHRVHTGSGDQKVKNNHYTPFCDYKKINTSNDKRLYANDYSAKDGITDSFTAIDDGMLYDSDSLFSTTVRVGINRSVSEDGFFKKEYICLKEGFSFAVYLTLSDGAALPEASTTVFLGQNKSAFTVNAVEATDNSEQAIKSLLTKGKYNGTTVVYCQSDIFAEHGAFSDALFSVIKTKTYRPFKTAMGRVTKGVDLYSLIAAGSVFLLPDDIGASEIEERVAKPNALVAGYNKILISKAEE